VGPFVFLRAFEGPSLGVSLESTPENSPKHHVGERTVQEPPRSTAKNPSPSVKAEGVGEDRPRPSKEAAQAPPRRPAVRRGMQKKTSAAMAATAPGNKQKFGLERRATAPRGTPREGVYAKSNQDARCFPVCIKTALCITTPSESFCSPQNRRSG